MQSTLLLYNNIQIIRVAKRDYIYIFLFQFKHYIYRFKLIFTNRSSYINRNVPIVSSCIILTLHTLGIRRLTLLLRVKKLIPPSHSRCNSRSKRGTHVSPTSESTNKNTLWY